MRRITVKLDNDHITVTHSVLTKDCYTMLMIGHFVNGISFDHQLKLRAAHDQLRYHELERWAPRGNPYDIS